MKFDLHVHSKYSQDAAGEIKEIIKKSKKIGLQGVAIVDHNEIKGALEALEFSEAENFVVIPGIEISTAQGHVIALGVKEIVPSNLELEETISKIRALSGIAIAPHPCRPFSKFASFEKVMALEIFNSRCWKFENKRAEKLSNNLKLGKTAGSDCHTLEELGYGITEFKTQSANYENLIEDIVKRRTTCYGSYTSKFRILCQSCKNFKLWLKRGCKRI
ncbi:MAG: PHP domain-containing protein [Candidatus Thermoplasmatota archaeon]|nr:PHP domain-containing protein [Candidatus Thermoplasmatota archaeon]